MLDPIDRIANARDGLDRAAQRFERANDRRETVSGADESGQVTVRMSPDGVVQDILIDAHWTTRLAPEKLGGAVLEAHMNAGIAGAEEWGRALAEEVDGPEPRTRPLPPTSESVYARLDQVASPAALAQRSEASLQAMVDLLTAVNRDVDRVSAEATALAQRTLVGEAKGAKVTVNGTGVVIGVEVDPEWARATSAANLSARLVGAYQAARRQARAHTVEELVSASSIGELQRLAADPHALAERLQLT
jgi:DNA-binding protein YbaB